MRILVVTVVHHPEDARILHREIAALRERGHEIVYAAPFTARSVAPRPYVEGWTCRGPRAAAAVRHCGRPASCSPNAGPKWIWCCCTTPNCCWPSPAPCVGGSAPAGPR